METIYLVIVIFLIALAISDLIVGVSNDAVNFLNSAIGARAARFWVIMIVAALGVLIGATFSSGMMEVARKGIFHPDQFFFAEIMIIFLAVMITDVILLDLFNTFGMPTSTTVSIIFELLGASVAVAIFKIYQNDEGMNQLGKYINSERALAIIFGIFISVAIAFTVGAFVQYLSRILFTFNFKKKVRYFGALWGGLAMMTITYFMIIKGVKGASFLNEESLEWISTHSGQIMLYSFIGWAVLFQLLNWIFRFNILRFIVLVGTFALAMAFAGNDLVNFIGVPLAGMESFRAWLNAGTPDPYSMTMEVIRQPVKTETYILLIAGAVMVATLWTSRKAKSVVETTVDLSRQGAGIERFGSTVLSRGIVRTTRNLASRISTIMPKPLLSSIDRRFTPITEEEEGAGAKQSFDMIRASVNLVVASVLIAYGTSHKLPLSTTYVTFMVAMGTSLADRAWGRESAVYRISGVMSVIGGWFLTAFAAFSMSFIMASIISLGGFVAIALLILLTLFVIFRTHYIHKKRHSISEEKRRLVEDNTMIAGSEVLKKSIDNVDITLKLAQHVFREIIEGAASEDLKKLRKAVKEVENLNKQTKLLKDNLDHTILKMYEDSIDSGHYYVQVVDYLREIMHCLSYISTPTYNHINNQHRGFDNEQDKELTQLSKKASEMLGQIQKMIDKRDFSTLNNTIEFQQSILDLIHVYRKNQIKRTKKEGKSTKRSILYLDILSETKNLLLYSVNMAKAMRDFILSIREPK